MSQWRKDIRLGTSDYGGSGRDSQLLRPLQGGVPGRAADRGDRRLNQKLGENLVAGDIPVIKPGIIQFTQNMNEIFCAGCLDPDQDRTEISCRFLKILKPRDIVFGAEYFKEVAQGPGPLRHP